MQAADVRELCTEEYIWAKGIEVIGGWEKLHNEDLHDLYSSPNIMWVIKSRRIRWAGLASCTRGKRNAYRVLVGKDDTCKN
jgi:hypothetical protein